MNKLMTLTQTNQTKITKQEPNAAAPQTNVAMNTKTRD